MVNVGTYTGGVESGTQDTDTIYLLDGVEQVSAGLHPSFADYYPTAVTQKTWLTDRKVSSLGQINIEVSDDDEGCIAFLNDSTIISGAALNVYYILYNESAIIASQGLTINSTNGAQLPSATDINQKLTYVMAYPKNIETWLTAGNRPSDNPTWTYYTITLTAAKLAGKSRSYRFNRKVYTGEA